MARDESQPASSRAAIRIRRSQSMATIPKRFHFVFGLAPDFANMPFSFIHYLSLRSAIEVNRPEEVVFHCKFRPSGEWWDRIAEAVHIDRVEPPTEIEGRPLINLAHVSDVLRLQILQSEGGIYADIDTIFVRDYAPLLDLAPVVLGEQGINGEEGIGNAIIMAQARAEFIGRWLQGYYPSTSPWTGYRCTGRDDHYLEYTNVFPAYLAARYPDSLHLEPYTSFYWPRAQESHFKWLYQENGASFAQNYSIHLWESLAWDGYLSRLTPQTLRDSDSNFARIVARFL